VKGKALALGMISAPTEYRVLDSFNYQIPKSEFTGQGEIEELNHLAARDKIKQVVVPSNTHLNNSMKVETSVEGSLNRDLREIRGRFESRGSEIQDLEVIENV
jgi:hypothetical protein